MRFALPSGGRVIIDLVDVAGRTVALIADGWIVLRFTWSQITRHPRWVCDIIRQTLGARSGVGA